MQPKSVFTSVGHAIDGVVHCLRTQKHMRLHFVLALLVVVIAVLLHVSDAQLLILIFSVTMVVVAEMLNTGIEVVVDIIKPNYDPRAKIIKDVAAGAVLLCGLCAGVVGLLVFLHSPAVVSFRERRYYPRYNSNWPELCLEALLILVILTVAWKVRGCEGSILRGGPISGRAAFGCFTMILVMLNPADEVRLVSALFMALLIVQGKSEPQNFRRVAQGALLGVLVPGMVLAAHYALAGPEDVFHFSIVSGMSQRVGQGHAAPIDR